MERPHLRKREEPDDLDDDDDSEDRPLTQEELDIIYGRKSPEWVELEHKLTEDIQRMHREWEEQHGHPYVNEEDEHEIYRAIRAGDVRKVRELLAADPYLVDSHQTVGALVPIHLAAREGQAEIVQILLDAGTPVDVISTHSEYHRFHTPLVTALEYGQLACVRVLMSAGAQLAFDDPTHFGTDRYRDVISYAIQGLHKDDRVADRVACLRLVVEAITAQHQGMVHSHLRWMLDHNIRSKGLRWQQAWEILLAGWQRATKTEWPYIHGYPTS